MLIRSLVVLPIAALAAVVVATSNVLETRQSTLACTGDDDFCCAELLAVSSTEASTLASENGANLSGVTGDIGVNCTPISDVATCSGKNVCCTGKNYNGRIITDCRTGCTYCD